MRSKTSRWWPVAGVASAVTVIGAVNIYAFVVAPEPLDVQVAQRELQAPQEPNLPVSTPSIANQETPTEAAVTPSTTPTARPSVASQTPTSVATPQPTVTPTATPSVPGTPTAQPSGAPERPTVDIPVPGNVQVQPHIGQPVIGQPEKPKPGKPKPEKPRPGNGTSNWPAREHVGPQTTNLTPSGSVKVLEDNTVIENLAVDGTIEVHANNVTIRNVQIRSNAQLYGIMVMKGKGGTLIENVDIAMGVHGRDSVGAIGGIGDNAGVHGKTHGANVTVRNSVMTGNGDGIKVANYSLYEGNYISMTRPKGSDNHIDGIQASGRTEFTIRNNHIDQSVGPGQNAAVFIQAYTGKRDNPVRNVYVHGNFLSGGSYAFHSEDGKHGRSGFLKQVYLSDNVFDRDFRYGPIRRATSEIKGNGGVWHDNGKRVRAK